MAAPLLDYCLGLPSVDLEMLCCLKNMRDEVRSWCDELTIVTSSPAVIIRDLALTSANGAGMCGLTTLFGRKRRGRLTT